MSSVRDTNMKIWDFLWLWHNITSVRDTGDSWHLAWELSGAEMSGHRTAGVPLFPNPCAPLSHKTQQPLYCREHIMTEEKGGRYQKPARNMFLLSCVRVLVWVWVLWACLFFPVTKSWHAPSETLSGWRQTRCDTWHGHDTCDTWRRDTWHVTRPCTLPLSSEPMVKK